METYIDKFIKLNYASQTPVTPHSGKGGVRGRVNVVTLFVLIISNYVPARSPNNRGRTIALYNSPSFLPRRQIQCIKFLPYDSPLDVDVCAWNSSHRRRRTRAVHEPALLSIFKTRYRVRYAWNINTKISSTWADQQAGHWPGKSDRRGDPVVVPTRAAGRCQKGRQVGRATKYRNSRFRLWFASIWLMRGTLWQSN